MSKAKVACLGEGLVMLAQDPIGALEAATSFRPGVGGAELNVAMALAALGVESAWLSRVGDDGFGRMLSSALTTRKVDISAIEIDHERPTGLYVKEIGRATGDPHDLGPGASQMHYYRRGSAASALSPSYLRLDAVRNVLRESGILHVSGITLALSNPAHKAIRRACREFDGLVSVDANWRAKLWAGREATGRRSLVRLMSSADIVFLGTDEASIILGTDDPQRIRDLIRKPRYIIVKDSGGVATGFDGRQRFGVPAARIEIVEAIGAGDAFAAGVLKGLLEGSDLEASLNQGHTTARRALASTSDQI